MKKRLFLFAFAALSFNAFSQLRIISELRFRTEYRFGYKTLPQESSLPAFFVTQRSRVGMMYDQEKYSLGLIVQDSRVWGDESTYNATSVSGDPASVDLKEAWLKVRPSPFFTVQIGRQEWVYDDERLLSRRDWGNMGMQYDGLLLKYKKSDIQADAGFSWNNRDENVFGEDYRYFQTLYYFDTLTQSIKSIQKESLSKIKSLNFIYLKKTLGEKFHLSFLELASLRQQPGTPDVFHLMHTFGPNFRLNISSFSLTGEAYYQSGKNMSGEIVSAYFTSLKVSYALKKLNFATGLDLISGNKLNNTTSENLFDLHYGNRHRYYGSLDYFSQPDKATLSGGLRDIFVKTSFKARENFDFGIDYHYFMLDQKVKNPLYPSSGSVYLDSYLAQEADVFFNLKFLKEISLKGGFSVLFPSESLETIQGISVGGAKTAKWFWLMMSVKPELFKGK